MAWEPELEELRRRTELAERQGGPDKVDRQHAAGRLTVRERIAALVDPGTFHEVGAIAGSATYDDRGELVDLRPANFVCGTARIDGRKVVLGGDDFTVRGGASDAAIAAKQVHAERMAGALRLPLVRLVEGTGGGGSVRSLDQIGATYVPANPGWDLVIDNLSVVPVVAAGLGPVAGLGAGRLAASHFAVMVEGTSQLFVAGPPVVELGMHENLTKEELGGAGVHRRSGAVDLFVPDEPAALDAVRAFLSYLPASVYRVPPVQACADPPDRRDDWLASAVPRNRRRPHDVRAIMASLFDAGTVFEHCRYGGATVTALARLDGHPVGVLAGDPYHGGGGLTDVGAEAMVRLVDLCQTFHLPLVVLTDQPGIAIGAEAERRGTIRAAVRATAAVYQATVPAAEVILRRVFGVGGAAMTNRHGFAARWAWPSGDWGSLPVEGGIEAAYRADLASAEDPAARREEIRAGLDAIRSPFRTAERFGIEELIDPRDTRPLLCEWVHDAYALLPEQLGRPSFGVRP
ncbi:MAG TPA: carboxyl transferase domain-containing protein [Acidimicrobiales bacterium]|nr:carboxyl transferase domain-containing protein [Acidimicrobiales bacterium]